MVVIPLLPWFSLFVIGNLIISDLKPQWFSLQVDQKGKAVMSWLKFEYPELLLP